METIDSSELQPKIIIYRKLTSFSFAAENSFISNNMTAFDVNFELRLSRILMKMMDMLPLNLQKF